MIGLKVTSPHQVEKVEGITTSRKRNTDGDFIGKHEPNPLLSSRQYVVKFYNGNYGEYAANKIINDIYQQTSEGGTSNTLFKCIIDYRRNDSTIPKERGWDYFTILYQETMCHYYRMVHTRRLRQ